MQWDSATCVTEDVRSPLNMSWVSDHSSLKRMCAFLWSLLGFIFIFAHQSWWSWNQCSGMPRSTFYAPSSWCIHTRCFSFSFCFAVTGYPSLASLKEIHTCLNIQSGELGWSHYFMSIVISRHKEGADSDTKKQETSHLDLIKTAIKNVPPIQGRTHWGRIYYFSVGKKHVAR